MKVLIISKTYIVRINQKKIQELSFNSDVEIRVIVPETWQEAIHRNLVADIPSGQAYQFCSLPTIFTGKGGRYLYRTLDLTLREFKPDIIQVEEDTRGLTVFQAAAYKRLWAPKAIFIPFTWVNVETPLFRPLYCFEKFSLSQSDAVICGNADAAENIRKKGFKRPVYKIPQLGIDIDAFQYRDGLRLRNKLLINQNSFVIGFAARMVMEKGPLLLIDAVAQLKGDWVLIMIGNGPVREEARHRAISLGIVDRVRFIDSLPHYELANYYNAMDVVVSSSISTSLWKEQFGLVLAQAMSSRVAVVGSSCGETPNLIGNAGLVFAEGDTSALVNQLLRLQNDKELRAKLGQLGVMRIREQYSNSKIAEQTYKVWRDLFYGR